ncbi:Proline--tRNA ligase [Frankliniella fusca]|uniref:Proline--tRNA ligase n=1 Tax=Frankliniella fusca TaxID=407009 RepID=A0AAE1HBP9_9NEOP|nr:Proline--tRNA ligase [Frankliniella fusca]
MLKALAPFSSTPNSDSKQSECDTKSVTTRPESKENRNPLKTESLECQNILSCKVDDGNERGTMSEDNDSVSTFNQSELAICNSEWKKRLQHIQTRSPISQDVRCAVWLQQQKLSDVEGHVSSRVSQLVDYSPSASKSASQVSAQETPSVSSPHPVNFLLPVMREKLLRVTKRLGYTNISSTHPSNSAEEFLSVPDTGKEVSAARDDVQQSKNDVPVNALMKSAHNTGLSVIDRTSPLSALDNGEQPESTRSSAFKVAPSKCSAASSGGGKRKLSIGSDDGASGDGAGDKPSAETETQVTQRSSRKKVTIVKELDADVSDLSESQFDFNSDFSSEDQYHPSEEDPLDSDDSEKEFTKRERTKRSAVTSVRSDSENLPKNGAKETSHNTSGNNGKKVPKRKPVVPDCQHNGDSFNCGILTQDTVEKLHSEYWSFGDWNKRVQYAANCMVIKDPERRRSGGKGRRQQSVQYFINVNGSKHRICRQAFLKTFSESDRFVRGVAAKKGNSISGCPSSDMRGRTKGSRRKLPETTAIAVETHIKSFPSYISHYCRQTTSQRYLASYLNVQKMYKRYKKEGNPPVSYSSYRRIFKKMGLKFKAPKSDTCATCDSFVVSIKAADGEEKERLTQEHERHKKRLQCLPVPDLPTGKVYYARQLYAYNLTIVHGKKTHCYMWAEHEARRGANEIASCLFHHITKELPSTVKYLTMFSDCCLGQNRNSIICAMLLAALQCNPTLKVVDHIFLVPGHTRMECDSKHSIIERCKKYSEKRAMIPCDWFDIVHEAGNGRFEVFHMKGHIYDFQRLLESKHNGPLIKRSKDVNNEEFRYLDTFWFQYTKKSKGFVHVKSSFKEEAPFRKVSFLRRGCHVSDIVENLVKVQSSYNPVSIQKKQDLLSLFNLIDAEYHDFYRSLKTSASLEDVDPDLPADENCD